MLLLSHFYCPSCHPQLVRGDDMSDTGAAPAEPTTGRLLPGEVKRLKALGAKLRKADREGNIFAATKIEREIESLRQAAGVA